MVLSPEGGALRKMLPVFRFGLGGILGSGEQYMSWIAKSDLIRAIIFLIDNPQPTGPFNLVAPNPVTNRDFTKALASALHRPASINLPASLVRFALGEMAQTTLLDSTRVVPSKLTAAGFEFKYPEISSALVEMLSKKAKR
jgi:uncharacterized protein (TIGR01777 family)